MPKLITTQTRIADLGKPRIIIIGGGFGGLEVAKGLLDSKTQIVLFDKYNHHTFQPLPAETFGRSARLRVDAFNRVKGYDNIFAIGDVALMEGDPGYPNGHPMMAPPAMQQGELLAGNLIRIIDKKPLKPFEYKDKGAMATVGRNKAVVDLKQFRFQGFFAWMVWMFVHLLSLIGFRNKVFVFINWFFSYFSYDKSNRLIIARPKDGVH